jgi:hypothetical protein
MDVHGMQIHKPGRLTTGRALTAATIVAVAGRAARGSIILVEIAGRTID